MRDFRSSDRGRTRGRAGSLGPVISAHPGARSCLHRILDLSRQPGSSALERGRVSGLEIPFQTATPAPSPTGDRFPESIITGQGDRTRAPQLDPEYERHGFSIVRIPYQAESTDLSLGRLARNEPANTAVAPKDTRIRTIVSQGSMRNGRR